MKLLVCMLLPTMAAGFVATAPFVFVSRVSVPATQLHMADAVASDDDQREQETAATTSTPTGEEMAPVQEGAVAPNFTGTAPLEQSLPTAGLPRDSYNKYGRLVDIDTNSYNRFGSGAAPTFSATAPAGTPPEVDTSSSYFKYKRLDEEFNRSAARSGFAKTKARAIFSATEVNERESADSGYYKYKTLNQEDNERALKASYLPKKTYTPENNIKAD